MKKWQKNGLEVTMSELSTSPTGARDGRRRVHRLNKPFYINIKSTDRSTLEWMNMEIKVPMHFHTDFATLPLFCQLVLGNRDDWMEAAVAHDWLCVKHINGWVANTWMRSIMLALGAPWWKRVAFFYGLQIFGYGSYLQKVGGRLWKWISTFGRKSAVDSSCR